MRTIKSLALALTCYIVIVIAGAAFVGWGEYTWPWQWAQVTRAYVFYEGFVIVAVATILLRSNMFKAGK